MIVRPFFFPGPMLTSESYITYLFDHLPQLSPPQTCQVDQALAFTPPCHRYIHSQFTTIR
jgi:hypothetical protein